MTGKAVAAKDGAEVFRARPLVAVHDNLGCLYTKLQVFLCILITQLGAGFERIAFMVVLPGSFEQHDVGSDSGYYVAVDVHGAVVCTYILQCILQIVVDCICHSTARIAVFVHGSQVGFIYRSIQ